jgi:hypothetical protein
MGVQVTEVVNPLWEDLVVSILSVNSYSLEKAFSYAGALRWEGLCNPHELSKLSSDEIAARLRKSGLDRGEFMTNLLANRLASLGEFITIRGANKIEQVLLSGDTTKIRSFLKPVKGIGPVVLNNFFLLQGGP